MTRRFWLFVGAFILFGFTLLINGVWGDSTVRGKPPARRLGEPLTRAQHIAQDVALSDAQVQTLTLGQRAELFDIKPVGQHVTPASAACLQLVCQQVEIYRFASNSTVAAIVDTESRTVLDVLVQPGLQPGINQRLAERAIKIALNHPDVIAELGFRPTQVDMAPVAAGMVGSVCERHLCAGPTFAVNGRILWAIVDLTEETLIGVNWTAVPGDGRADEPRGDEPCPAPGSVNRDGWQLSYETTGTDGLRVFDAAYNGQSVLHSAKLVEWHVDYNGTYHIAGFLDVTGCGGTGGFFVYPTGETLLLELMDGGNSVGFELVQDFRMPNYGQSCNYRYEQRMQFFDDGRFRIISGAYGRGCGFSPVYRPVVRIDLALDAADQELTGVWDGARWQIPEQELYLTPDSAAYGAAGHSLAPNGALLWQMNQNGRGYFMVPGAGQFGDGGRGDTPFVYLTRFDPAEGAADLPVFGGLCCEDDHKQGPHLFVDGEPIQNERVVLWYVAQHQTEVSLSNPSLNYCWTWNGTADTAPCFGGPLFVPFDGNGLMQSDFVISDTTIDFPETAVFTNTSTVTGTFPFNYRWAFGDGQTSLEASPTHLYLLNGTFTPTLTLDAFANGESTAGKTAVAVRVNNLFLPKLLSE